VAITIKDLARLCGVSVGTVDRALRDREGIRPATRERILATAKEHGYKPNIVARNLKTRRTWEIGLIVHDLENEFFAELVNAVQETAWTKGYFIQIAVSRRQPERERSALEHMAGRNVDGILLFPTSADPGFDAFLHGLGRPLVTIANRVSPVWPFVGLRDRAVLREATRQIISRGYRRLLFVGPLDAFPTRINLYEIEERYRGLQEAAAETPGVQTVLLSRADYVERIRGMDLGSVRTAVICASDIFALEIMTDLRSRGVSVPADVGIMGFDSIDALRYISPRLSTVEYPVTRMGETAFAMLVEARDGAGPDGGPGPRGGPVPSIELDPRILWGESL
jgi:LacI family transcriptional regulator